MKRGRRGTSFSETQTTFATHRSPTWQEETVTILNLGCGTRTSPLTVNIDWSLYLRAARSRFGQHVAPIVLRGYRLEAFRAIDGEIVVHDLRKGIPWPDASVDAVYHSHVLEHIDREATPAFLAEVLRVLLPGGTHRIVVPDFEAPVRRYLASLDREAPDHDETLVPLLGQSVRREASGTSKQRPARRRIENLLLGDARTRGETHQWMYDRVNLRRCLERAGFVDCEPVGPTQSRIPDWDATHLDTDPDGTVHKPGSLWMEASKAPLA
jgi:SAM-dependent methyltransferase